MVCAAFGSGARPVGAAVAAAAEGAHRATWGDWVFCFGGRGRRCGRSSASRGLGFDAGAADRVVMACVVSTTAGLPVTGWPTVTLARFVPGVPGAEHAAISAQTPIAPAHFALATDAAMVMLGIYPPAFDRINVL